MGRRTLLLWLMLAAAPMACGAGGRPKNAIAINFGSNTLWAEVADEEAERQQGLMFRREMGKDAGMIFVFEEARKVSFWMKDTPLPLDIAYLDESRRILNIRQMAPFDDRTYHYSEGAALYAVEAHQGWFAAHGIKAGDVAEFELPAKGSRAK